MKPPILGKISPIIPAGDDVEKAIAFYEEQLGFTVLYQEGQPITLALVQRDAAEIFLQKNADQHLAEWTTFRIEVQQIEALYQELQAKGGRMIHPKGQLELKPWGMKEFVILDPAGVAITFYERVSP